VSKQNMLIMHTCELKTGRDLALQNFKTWKFYDLKTYIIIL